MSKETIELLKILKDETQSRSVFDRCDAVIARLESPPTPREVLSMWKAAANSDNYVSWTTDNGADVWMVHLPEAIRDGEEVRIK